MIVTYKIIFIKIDKLLITTFQFYTIICEGQICLGSIVQIEFPHFHKL